AGESNPIKLESCNKKIKERDWKANDYYKCNDQTTTSLAYECPSSTTKGILQAIEPEFKCYKK
ncbi:MAG: hypothetical protein LIO93_01555, partial [Bacteroidales bacterium]|nr:hypothetical protein [Bacteroidales bacterium]